MGVNETLINLIILCISSVFTALIWNGEITESFMPKRGLKQGCPLSISFCPLYGDLSKQIQAAINHKKVETDPGGQRQYFVLIYFWQMTSSSLDDFKMILKFLLCNY